MVTSCLQMNTKASFAYIDGVPALEWLFIWLTTASAQDTVDLQEVEKVFPYGETFFEVWHH